MRNTWLYRLAVSLIAACIGPALIAPAAHSLSVRPHAVASGDQSLSVAVDSVNPSIWGPNRTITIAGTVTNTTKAPIKDAKVYIRLDRTGLTTRSSVEFWYDLSPADRPGTEIASTTLPAVIQPGRSATYSVSLPASAAKLSSRSTAWGAYGVSVEVGTDSVRQIDVERTSIVWDTGADVTPTSLAMVIPFTSTAVDPLTGYADTETLREETTTGGRLATLLTAAEDSMYTWVIDPILLATARSDSDSIVSQWLADWTTAAEKQDLFALYYGDPNFSLLRDKTTQRLLPLAKQFSDKTWESLRKDEDLAKVTPQGTIAWPISASFDNSVGSLVSESDFDVLMLSSASVMNSALVYTPTGRTTVRSAPKTPTVVADKTLSAVVSDSGTNSAALTAQRMLTETAVINAERPNDQRTVLAAFDRSWEPDAGTLNKLTSALKNASWVENVSLSTMKKEPVPTQTWRQPLQQPMITDGTVTKALHDVADAAAHLTQFAGFLTDPAPTIEPLQRTLTIPASTAWQDRAADQISASTVVISNVTDLTSRLSIVSGTSTVNQLSESVSIPVVVKNRLDVNATVTVQLIPRNARIKTTPVKNQVIAAHSQRSIRVPVEAFADGDVLVDAVLKSADGTVLRDPTGAEEVTRFNVSVRAGLETIGTAITAVVIVILIIIGVVRVIRRGRHPDGTIASRVTVSESEMKETEGTSE